MNHCHTCKNFVNVFLSFTFSRMAYCSFCASTLLAIPGLLTCHTIVFFLFWGVLSLFLFSCQCHSANVQTALLTACWFPCNYILWQLFLVCPFTLFALSFAFLLSLWNCTDLTVSLYWRLNFSFSVLNNPSDVSHISSSAWVGIFKNCNPFWPSQFSSMLFYVYQQHHMI